MASTKGASTSSTRLLGSGSMEADVRRSRGRAKTYFFIFAVIFFVLLLDSVISLGAFGVIQKRVHDFSSHLPSGSRCILFGHYDGQNEDEKPLIRLPDLGVCAFTLWGQVSITIVAFVWFLYSIVLIALGPQV